MLTSGFKKTPFPVHELNFMISEVEFHNVTSGLRLRRAAGRNKILNEMVKASSTEFLSYFTKVFNPLLT